MRLLSPLPWKTHAALSILCPVILVLPPLRLRGVGPEDGLPTELLMSYGFYIFAWVATVPFIWIEVTAALNHRPDVARASAAFAHTVLALVGTLPVTLHYALTLSSEPVGIDSTQSAGVSYALLLAGYFVATTAVTGARLRDARRSAQGPSSQPLS